MLYIDRLRHTSICEMHLLAAVQEGAIQPKNLQETVTICQTAFDITKMQLMNTGERLLADCMWMQSCYKNGITGSVCLTAASTLQVLCILFMRCLHAVTAHA